MSRLPGRAIFFDLDGTLLDTAPDMVGALDALRAEQSLAGVAYAPARAQVSNGAIGMLRHGFPQLDDAGHEALRERYLQLYAQRLSLSTRLFPGLAELLKSLEQAGLAWGIVTNKPAYLTEPLLSALELAGRCACIVSGDTLPRRKPHPDPLLHAARLAGVPAEAAMYIGDARRDIEAGQAAGMTTVAAIYGYIDPAEDPAAWGADYTVTEPGELQPLLRRAGWLPEI